MSPAAAIADQYDAVMADVIGLAQACSDQDWALACADDSRPVGLVVAHLAAGNVQIVEWVCEFLAGRPVPITPDTLNDQNAAQALAAASSSRADTIARLQETTATTSAFIRALTDDQLGLTQEFGWAGTRTVEWVASSAFRHPSGHLQTIRQTLPG